MFWNRRQACEEIVARLGLGVNPRDGVAIVAFVERDRNDVPGQGRK